MADKAHVAQKTPIPFEVEAGKTYWWCACGLSKNQPFCDGSHKSTPHVPREFKALDSKRVFFCACKQTGDPPLCDGSHNAL